MRLRFAPVLCTLALLAACQHQEAGEKSPRNRVELGPWLLDPQPGSITVAWTTPRPAVGVVEYGQGGKLDKRAAEAAPTHDHRVTLAGLPAGEKIDYRIEGEPTAQGTFTSAPAPDADPFQRPYSVLVYGDNRTNGGDHALLVRAAEPENPDLALHTGDMVVDAKQQKQWSVWFDVERDLLARTPLVPTVGNHEITDSGVTYSRHFKLPGRPTFRQVDYGNLHVLVLDSFELAAGAEPHHGAVSDAQRAWAEAAVKSIPKEHHLWVLVHQGPFAHPIKMRRGHGGSAAVKALLLAVNAIHPIGAVFAGHEHFYERGTIEGLHFFVLGGGGAPLEDPDPTVPGVHKALKALSFVTIDVCGCHAVGRAKDIAGRVLDEFVLSDCPQACAVKHPAFAGGAVAAAAAAAATEGEPAAAAAGAAASAPASASAGAPASAPAGAAAPADASAAAVAPPPVRPPPPAPPSPSKRRAAPPSPTTESRP